MLAHRKSHRKPGLTVKFLSVMSAEQVSANSLRISHFTVRYVWGFFLLDSFKSTNEN